MRKLPPLHAIRIFEACAQLLNFSVAARELCLTHSAVSHQIRQLEDWFGQPLFTRHADGVQLTSTGEVLARTATQSLSQLETICAQILSRTEAQAIRLAAPSSFIALWLIPRLEAFERANPDIRLQLQTHGDYQDLINQRIDALIISTAPPWPKGIEASTLFADRAGPVCSPQWSNLPKTAPDILDQPLLATLSRRDAWDSWAKLQGLDTTRLKQARHFDNLQLMLEGAIAKLGIAIAPEQLAQRDVEQGRLIAPLGFAPSDSVFALCTTQSRAHEGTLTALKAWMIEVCSA